MDRRYQRLSYADARNIYTVIIIGWLETPVKRNPRVDDENSIVILVPRYDGVEHELVHNNGILTLRPTSTSIPLDPHTASTLPIIIWSPVQNMKGRRTFLIGQRES